jgi:hypothetical protein
VLLVSVVLLLADVLLFGAMDSNWDSVMPLPLVSSFV